MPIYNEFDTAPQPLGYQGLDSYRLQNKGAVRSSADLAPIGMPAAGGATRPGAAPAPSMGMEAAGSAMAGLSAASSIGTGGVDDTTSALLSTGASTLAGGLMGGLAAGAAAGGLGGPAGAAIGASAGLLIGGVNAYLSLRARNKQKRDAEQLASQIDERNRKTYLQQRADYLDALGYDRKQAALGARVQAFEKVHSDMQGMMQNNAALKQMWVERGYR